LLSAFVTHPKRSDEGNRTPQKKRREQNTKATQPALHTLLSAALPSRSRNLLNFVIDQGTPLPRHPKIKEITNSTRNMKNRSFAMPADAAAIPPNPKTAATSAMIKNTTAQPNIFTSSQTKSHLEIVSRASARLLPVEVVEIT
jgi:hypothetical protein